MCESSEGSAKATLMPEWQSARRVRDLRQDVKANERRLPRALPLSRLECVDIPRPCPFVSCRYNMYTDVTRSGSLVVRACDPLDMPAETSCALDIAEDGEHTLDEIAELEGLTHQGVIWLLQTVIERLRDNRVVYDMQEMAMAEGGEPGVPTPRGVTQ